MKHYAIIKPLPKEGKINVDTIEKATDVLIYLTALKYTNIGEQPYRTTLESFICWGQDTTDKYVRFRKQGEYEFYKIVYEECMFDEYFREIEDKTLPQPIASTGAPLETYEPLKYWLEYAN